MRVTKALLIASAALMAAPLSAQATNEAYPADNAVVANDVAAPDAMATNEVAPEAMPPAAEPTTVPVDDTAPPAPADNGGGGFPWGVLGLLGLLGLVPRLRR